MSWLSIFTGARHTGTPSVVLLLSLVHLDLPVYSRIDEWVTF